MALERPGPNSSSPTEARQWSEALAGGLQGPQPEQEGVAVRGPWPALSPPRPAVHLLWFTCDQGRHRKASEVPAAPVAWLPSAPLALERGLAETQRSAVPGCVYKSGMGTGGWVLWGLFRVLTCQGGL